MEANARSWPKYQCHKRVWALKIAVLGERAQDGSAVMVPLEAGHGPVMLSSEFMDKHKPQVGGYYVVYDDGYKSWSPAKAFEEGYTAI